jgi:hypothetical protein
VLQGVFTVNRVTGETHFKGWAKPGPVPHGLSAGLTVASDESLDAISGRFACFNRAPVTCGRQTGG